MLIVRVGNLSTFVQMSRPDMHHIETVAKLLHNIIVDAQITTQIVRAGRFMIQIDFIISSWKFHLDSRQVRASATLKADHTVMMIRLEVNEGFLYSSLFHEGQ